MQHSISYEQLSYKINKQKNIFIVAGKSFTKTDFSTKVNIRNNNVAIHRFSNFTDNPNIEEVMQGVKSFQSSGASLIVALGGGTAIDLAKLIKYYSTYSFTGKEHKPPTITNVDNTIAIIAIPTTFGTGSEATHFAVVYIKDTKYSVSDQSILPNFYLLDSQFSFTLPLSVKASACLDALCQAIESYWNINRTERSSQYAIEAIKEISENYDNYLTKPTQSVNDAIAIASHKAGKAINITKTTAPHALSYALTSKYSLLHGQAVSLCCRGMFEVIINRALDENNDVLTTIMSDIFSALGVSNHFQAKELINSYLNSGGLECSFNKIGLVDAATRNIIVDTVNQERLKNHPIKMQHSELTRLLCD